MSAIQISSLDRSPLRNPQQRPDGRWCPLSFSRHRSTYVDWDPRFPALAPVVAQNPRTPPTATRRCLLFLSFFLLVCVEDDRRPSTFRFTDVLLPQLPPLYLVHEHIHAQENLDHWELSGMQRFCEEGTELSVLLSV